MPLNGGASATGMEEARHQEATGIFLWEIQELETSPAVPNRRFSKVQENAIKL